MRIAKELGATSKNLHSFRALPSNYESQPEAFWCTSGGAAGGVLRGAAFRQRPLSRLLRNVLAGTRRLPPEEPAPKYSVSLGAEG